MTRYTREPRTNWYDKEKDMDFCHLREIYLNMEKKLMNTDTKTGLDALKTASK